MTTPLGTFFFTKPAANALRKTFNSASGITRYRFLSKYSFCSAKQSAVSLSVGTGSVLHMLNRLVRIDVLWPRALLVHGRILISRGIIFFTLSDCTSVNDNGYFAHPDDKLNNQVAQKNDHNEPPKHQQEHDIKNRQKEKPQFVVFF